MKDGQIKVWLPAIQTGTGSDVFVRRLAQSLEKHNITTEITWYPLMLEPLAPLLRLARAPEGTDIVFTNSWNGFAFKRQGIPLVVTLHHGGFDQATWQHRSMAQRLYRSWLIEAFEKQSFRQADRITAVSQFSADSAQAHLPSGKTIHTIYNWVDTDIFRPADQDSSPQRSVFKLLFVGKPTRLKGGDLLAPLMRRLGTQFELHIAGKNYFIPDSPPNIHSLGWLDQTALVRAYQNCDALIVPSYSEGFGYAVLEAMACGKTVIASAAAALPELITDGINGVLCEPGNIEAFAEAIEYLAKSSGTASALGMNARQKTLEFSEAAALKQYLSLIAQLSDETQKKYH